MAIPEAQGERWGTNTVVLEGGLYLDKDVLYQAMKMPGSARTLTNFEPSLDGGYHRILGYAPFDPAQPGGTSGQVFGVVVNPMEDIITAFKGGNTYQSSGSGWTRINGADVHTSMGVVQHTKYTWATNRFTFVDGDPAAHPVRIEATGTYTILTNAPTGQKFIQEFAGYMWLTAGDGTLTFSAPNNDNNYSALSGAGTLNVGFSIVGLGVWRGALYVFGKFRIAQVTGTSAADWIVTPLTDNIGMTAPYTLQEVNGDLVFLSSDGLRTISGTARIFDRELGVISRPINTVVLPLGSANMASGVVKTKSQYRLFQGTANTNTGTFPGILGALKQQTTGSVAWEWATMSGMVVSCMDSGLFQSNELVVHGAFDGFVYKQESGTDFNGVAISAIYESPDLVYNDPNIRKILYKLCADFRTTGAAVISLGVQFDNGFTGVLQPPDQSLSLTGGGALWDDGVTTWDSGVFWDVPPEIRVCANLIGSGFSSAFAFSTVGGADYSLQAYTVNYGQGARR